MNAIGGAGASLSRGRALVRKECLQILRDPSAFLIAGVLPLLLLFLFGTGGSLDLCNVRLAVVVEQMSPEAASLLDAYRNSPSFCVRVARHRAEVDADLVAGRLAGIVVLREDFAERLGRGDQVPIQVIVVGSDPNTAALVEGYVQGVWRGWIALEATSRASLVDRPAASPLVTAEPRLWFNANLDARASLLPGGIAINLTLIGMLLTAPVVAREWVRGTMESLLSTPAMRWEMLVGKIVPYLGLGLVAMAVSAAAAVWVFGVPFQGSIALLYLSIVVYLCALIGVGLLVSSVARTQQQAILYSFMVMVPAMLLSGFATLVENMPDWLQTITLANSVRHFMAILKGLFLKDLAGVEVARRLIPLLIIAGCTLTSASWLFRRRLE